MTERIMPNDDARELAASANLARELLGVAREDHHEQEDGELEAEIRNSEEALGIRTTPARLTEAGLAIDKRFLDTAIITGQPAGPERIFGDREWAGHLAARLFAREYGKQPLTIDFILAMHQRFLDNIEPGKISMIKDGYAGRGGQYVAGYRGASIVSQLAPITCTDEQIAAINDNPLLKFVIDEGSARPNTGFIDYPDMPIKERRERLDEICAEYNAASQYDTDPHRDAATLQRRFVSLRPLSVDFTGRTSRALMNWALENAGESPSIVDDPGDDLFLSEDKWVESVRAGSMRYARYKLRAEAGETNPVVLFGLEQEKRRYEESLGVAGSTPALVGDGWHDHVQFERFLASLRSPVQNKPISLR